MTVKLDVRVDVGETILGDKSLKFALLREN